MYLRTLIDNKLDYYYTLFFYNKLFKKNIKIGFLSKIGKYTSIGAGTNINGKCYINSRINSPVKIGKYCAIAHNFRIRTTNHNVLCPNISEKLQKKLKGPSLSISKGPVEIGNACWIGDNVIILSGVKIGNGCVIAAGSVVTKSIEPYSIVGGVPAKLLKKRFDTKTIQKIEKLQWWDWSEKKMIERREEIIYEFKG
jgi:acetyltransferase-like isoleucine patch superfamily enzyme